MTDQPLPGVVHAAPCPGCGNNHLARSRTRNWLEALRKNWREERLFRCSTCGWRGWLLPLGAPIPFDEAVAQLNLSSVDGPAPEPTVVSLERLDEPE